MALPKHSTDRPRQLPKSRFWPRLLSLVTVSSLTLADVWFGWVLHLDERLFRGAIGAVFPGTMPWATALAFLSLGDAAE